MQSAPTAAIALSGVTKAYALRRAQTVRALEAIDRQVAPGAFVAPAEGLVDPDTGAAFPQTAASPLAVYDRNGPVPDNERFLEAQ